MYEETYIDTESNPFLSDQLFGTADADPEPEPAAEPEATGPSPEQVASWQQAHGMLEQLRTNPQVMRNFVLMQAQQMGLQVSEPQPQQRAPQGPPADYVESVKANLPQELQFLAPHLAKATWTATEARIAPLQHRQQQQDAQTRQQTYDGMARELSTETPGWERYEDEMLNILGFMRSALDGSGSMSHPKYGSALKLLYKLASGDSQATANAGRRMQEALRSGTRTSAGGTRGGGPDLSTMIANAKSPQAKWGLAFQAALRKHGAA